MRFPAVALAPSRLYRSAHRRNWRSASELKASSRGRSARFSERNLGYFITGSGGVRQSHDGGRTRRRVGFVAPLVAVDFVSATDGSPNQDEEPCGRRRW